VRYRSKSVDGEGSTVRVEIYWPDPEAGPYLVRVTLDNVDDRLEIVGVEIWGRDADEVGWSNRAPAGELTPVTSTAIRLPLDHIATEALHSSRVSPEDDEWNYAGKGEQNDPMAEFYRRTNEKLRKLKGARQTGRPTQYDESHFAAVAQVYSQALATHQNPTGAVAERFSVSKSAAAKWVARCRAMGLLPPTTRGRSAGGSQAEQG
jgi:hypothetical protein